VKRSVLILLSTLLLVLSPALVPRAVHAASYLPGVSPNQYVDFHQVTEYSNGTLPPGTNSLENVSSIHNMVQSVSGHNVTSTVTFTFSNNTAPRNQVFSGNVETGAGNLTFLILSGGLSAGDHVFQSSQLGIAQIVINETVTRSYGGLMRSVNVWNETFVFGTYFEKFALFWDAETGFLVELSESGLIPSSSIMTHHIAFVIDAKIGSTNAWTPSSTQDFSLDASPSAPTRIAPGESLNYKLNLTSYSGFTGPVSIQAVLAASNSTVASPPRLSLQTNSVTLTPGGSTTDFLTITANSTLSITGLYIVEVTGSTTSLSHLAKLTFTISSGSSQFDYVLSNNGPRIIPAGGTGVVTIGATLTAGTGQPVTLSCLAPALPQGITCASFNPPSITPALPNATSALFIDVASSVAADTYYIPVTGSPSGATPSLTVVQVNVTGSAPFDYSLFDGGPVTISAGSSGHAMIIALLTGGTAEPVTLACGGSSLPPGVTCSGFSPNPVTPTMVGAASDLTINVASNVAEGSYALNVTGTPSGATVTGSRTIVQLTVTSKHTTITTVPDVSCTIASGGSSCTATVIATVSDTTTSPTDPSGTVTFSLTAGTTGGSLDQSSCSLSTTSSVTSCSVTFTGTSVGYGYLIGDYGGDSSHQPSTTGLVAVTVTAPTDDTTTLVTNASCNIASGSSVCSATMSVVVADPTNPSNIPQGTVTFNLSAGTTGAYLSSITCALSAYGTCTDDIWGTSAGVATVTANYNGDTAHNGSTSAPATFTVTVSVPFDYSLSASSSSGSVVAGSSTSITITATLTGGTGVPITLAASLSPTPAVCAAYYSNPCWTLTFSPASLTPTSAGATSTLTISTTSVAPAGTYTLTITGDPAGSSSSSATFTLTIPAPSPGDFSISASPESLTIQVGDQGISTITASPSGGFTYDVDLTATISPSEPAISLSHSTISTGYGSRPTSATVTVSVGTGVAPGIYTVTIHGTSGSLSHTKQITVRVTAGPQPVASSNPDILGLAPAILYALIIGIIVVVVAASLVFVLRMRKPQTKP
jgi:hypothetical protein